MGSKMCSRCLTVKDAEADFVKNAAEADGRSRTCRECDRQYRLAHGGAKKRSPKVQLTQTAPTPSGTLTTAATDYIPLPEVVGTWAGVLRLAERGRPAPALMFLGPSGSGKSEATAHLASLAGLERVKIDAPSITDPEAWFGTREVIEENGVPVTVVHDSAFVSAIQRPCVLVIDEFNRTNDFIRGIILGLLDDSREVTNPLTGQPLVRHPQCFIMLTGNVGLSFTGTYAIDPAFYTRALTTVFTYLETDLEVAVAMSRTGCDPDTARLVVRFAHDSRETAKSQEDFEPVSTREVIMACDLVAVGLDVQTAVYQAVINAASNEGGAQSRRFRLEAIWTGIRAK